MPEGSWKKIPRLSRWKADGYYRRAWWGIIPLPWHEWRVVRAGEVIAQGVGFGARYAKSQAWAWASSAA